MPDDKRLDPFKPQQPHIPGVPETGETKKPPQPTRPASVPKQATPQMLPLWVGLGVGAFLILGVVFTWWIYASSPKRAAPAPRAAAPSPPVAKAPKAVKSLPLGPGVVATTDELARVWAAKRFLFPDPLTHEQMPAMVVRLPGGDYWGFSLREPFGTCELEYVTDLQKLETKYNFHASHPMVGDPCNHSVFDLAQYGTGPNGAVRGDVVLGAAVRPLIAIEIRARGKQVLAVRLE